MTEKLIQWLLAGDVSIQYQTRRDLLGEEEPDLQARIAAEGWGARLLACRNRNGSWGRGFYQPKWTSSHYTLLDLKTLEVSHDHPLIRESVHKINMENKGRDGGINPAKTIEQSDVCVNGMFLNYAAYFGEPEVYLRSVVDFLLEQQMADGGFNCESNQHGAVHSSLHTSLSVVEGILQYTCDGYSYRLGELEKAAVEAREFILQHRLFLSDHSGQIIRQDFLKLSFPPRWKYNILRALDYFRATGASWDPRMKPAVEVLLKKRRTDGSWQLQAPHPGRVHFEMELAGKPSRWNTLLALRVLRFYGFGAEKGVEVP